jgi:vitamin K-dependent gamma-carboxylase-like protein
VSALDDPARAYRIVAAIAGTGVFWITLRHLALWRWFRPDGVYPWRLPGERAATGRRQRPHLLLEHPGLTAVLFVRGAAAAWTAVAAATGAPERLPVTLLLAATLIKKWRLPLISEEAEVMNVMILFPLFFHTWAPHDDVVARAGLWFIAAQVCLAYFGAGFSKLRSASWRSGVALAQILDGSLVRNPRLGRLFNGGAAGKLACWGTIALELAFPFAPLLPQPALFALLGAGAAFHLAIAATFGLGSFLWAFLATYPAVIFVNAEISRWLR